MTNYLINPFDLLGVNLNTPIKLLKKKYYDLAIICHPDKGGNKDDMIIITNCYLYVKKQLENQKINNNDISTCYLNLEEEFKNFCTNQTEDLQSFYEIFKDTNNFSRNFNSEFEKNSQNNEFNPFSDGYQYLMDKEEYSNECLEEIIYPISNCYQNSENEISKEIAIYQEPECFKDNYGQFENINNQPITDFSTEINKLFLTDYKKAHSVLNYKDFENDEDKYLYNLGINKVQYEKKINSVLNLENFIAERDEELNKFKIEQKRNKIDQTNLFLKNFNNEIKFNLE